MTDKAEKTKLQKAIDYIFTHPGCRSDKLAEVLGCEARNVLAYVKDAVSGGLIVTCTVERRIDGRPTRCNEFKPSAQAPEKAPDWKEWKKAHVAPTPEKPLVFKADGPRAKNVGSVSETPAGGGEHITGSRESESPVGAASTSAEVAAVVETQAADVMAAEDTAPTVSDPAASDVTEEAALFAMVSSEGKLVIKYGEILVKLSKANTRRLGTFLADTEPAWA